MYNFYNIYLNLHFIIIKNSGIYQNQQQYSWMQSEHKEINDQQKCINENKLNLAEMMTGKKTYTCNIDKIIDTLTKKSAFTNQLLVSQEQIKCLLRVTRDIFLSQQSLLRLQAPISICGDLHGQFNDLLRIFEINGAPNDNNQYLFLGDYVDRGVQSTQTMCLLLAYKIKYSKNFFILRGNHQTASLNKTYGFYNQCCRKYSIKLWKSFVKCFNCMPVAALVSDRIFCMHGGISPYMIRINQIQAIQRPCDVQTKGLLCDLMWSDPQSKFQGLFAESSRGAGYIFGKQATQLFLQANQLDLIVRAHQIVQDGYEFSFNRKIITIFSAPNYCNKFTNDCAILKIDQILKCSLLRISPVNKMKQHTTKEQFAQYEAHQCNQMNDLEIVQNVNNNPQTKISEQDSVVQPNNYRTKKISKIANSIKNIACKRRMRSKSMQPKKFEKQQTSTTGSQYLQNGNSRDSWQIKSMCQSLISLTPKIMIQIRDGPLLQNQIDLQSDDQVIDLINDYQMKQ